MSDWRRTKEYRDWRKIVIERDPKCFPCGETEHLHAHHIKHASYWPSLRFDPRNGVAMCVRCHSRFHNDHKRSTRVKCDEVDLMNFNSLYLYFKKVFGKRTSY